MDGAILIEVALRAGTAALCLLIAAGLLAGGRSNTARLGALFAIGSAAYIICHPPLLLDALGLARFLILPVGDLEAVFFYWFALSLFNDRFCWRLHCLWPVVPIGLTHLVVRTLPDTSAAAAAEWIGAGFILFFMGHAITLALRHLADDLVVHRRGFRVFFSLAVGALSITMVVIKLTDAPGDVVAVYGRIEAVIAFGLALAFGLWALKAREDVFSQPPETTPIGRADQVISAIAPEDRPIIARLQAEMGNGRYRQPGLTVGELAAIVGTTEHRLRKLINQGLGYRNFSSFLNEARIADAKAILADPEESRTQIVQVAFDLGYGSIASFNRAFRDATGMSPTVFRRRELSRA